MPRSINGFGTSYHGGAAGIRWEKPDSLAPPADHDAVECAIMLGFPVFPFSAFHTFAWSSKECQTIPIRKSVALVLRALLRPYFLVATWLSGIALCGMGAIALAGVLLGKTLHPQPGFWTFLAADAVTFVNGLAVLTGLRLLFRRTRDLRLIIGPHEAGSSDPATWKHAPSTELLQTHSLEAAHRALAEGQFSRAMFAARLLASQGDRRAESLTDKILSDRRISKQLPLLRRKPWLRKELFPEDASLRIPFENHRWYVSPHSTTSATNADRV